jgi:adenine/guanine phosphoribosyltransferase-like PRPP-binding protein
MYLILSGAQLKRKADLLIRRIKDSKLKFDFIAFRGYSGALVASLVASSLSKPLSLVRKRGDRSHSTYGHDCGEYVEYDNSLIDTFLCKGRYIIIDDFIDTGKTLLKIKKAIDNESANNVVCVGVFLYNNSNSVNCKPNCISASGDLAPKFFKEFAGVLFSTLNKRATSYVE